MSQDDDIIARLDAADKTRPSLPQGLMERVLADATAIQIAAQPASNVVALARPRPAFGWGAGAALAASALMGLMLGYGSPDLLGGVSTLADLVSGSSAGLSSGFDELGTMSTFLAEG